MKTMTQYPGVLNCLFDRGLLNDDEVFSRENLMFETLAGSYARGTDISDSDIDIVGVFVPPKNTVYTSRVPGFGRSQNMSTTVQYPDMHVSFNGMDVVLDVTMINVIHLFNSLVKPSPNHVEYLFFSDFDRVYGSAGSALLSSRDLFITRDLMTKMISAGGAIIKQANADKKKFLIGARFLSYAIQIAKLGVIDPLRLKGVFRKYSTMSETSARMFAETLFKHAVSLENNAYNCLPEYDEYKVNALLYIIMSTHWRSRYYG